METSILQKLKKSAGRIIEPSLLKAGRILDIRIWNATSLIEIDLHLPMADMQQWHEVPYIKFRVDDFCYRDYTPFGWDAGTHTCSIIVDAGHSGPGSSWARKLKPNDTVQYFKIDTTHHAPHRTHMVVGLGDESSIGHLLALQQMTLPRTRFSGAVLMTGAEQGELLAEYFGSNLQAIAAQLTGDETLSNWVIMQNYHIANTTFYLTGNHNLVSRLRRLLKTLGYTSQQIKVKGFWS